jgi:hypothetical protein
MDQNMILRSGKYQGYTVREAYRKDPSYIRWVIENVPAMLKSHGPSKRAKVVEARKPFEYKQPPDVEKTIENGWIPPGSVEDAFL